MLTRFLALVLAFSLSLSSLALADKGRGRGEREDRHGHERHEEQEHREAISRAVERGEALPLADVLKIVRASYPGEVVGVEIESESGAWHYEVRVAKENGRLVEVYVDAGTGTILKAEDK